MSTASPDSSAASSQADQSPRIVKLKEKIENNLAVFFLGTLLTGFLAGLGTYQGALKLIDYEAVPSKMYQSVKDGLTTATSKAERLQQELDAQRARPVAQRWLRIKGVQGLAETNARIVAFVNGRAYSYPSRTVWSRLRPGMPPEDFPLPSGANGYDVSFQLLALDQRGNFQQFGSQQVLEIKQPTFDGTYEVFVFGVGSAGSAKCPPGTTRGIPTCESVNAPAPGLVQVQFEIR
jgi:hypothetical protein